MPQNEHILKAFHLIHDKFIVDISRIMEVSIC